MGSPSGVRLTLASASPRRLALLKQIGVEPDEVAPTHIDETPKPGETPKPLADRLAREKALASDADGIVLAADTVVGVGRRILPKTETPEEAEACLRLMSGRAHQVHTGVAVRAPDGALSVRTVSTRVQFKRLTEDEIAAYIDSAEWRGVAGGYAIQGLAGAYVRGLSGSYTGVVGLPLFETRALLEGVGWR